MIDFVTGDLVSADVDAIVNPCNTLGVMGAGLAKQIKNKFPACVESYETACSEGSLFVGSVLVTPTQHFTKPNWVIHVPTKEDWRHPSTLKIVETSLRALVEELTKRLEIMSVGIPALGCGLGGLDWYNVKPLMMHYLQELDDIHFLIYPPR